MAKYNWGKKSNEVLNTLHEDWKIILPIVLNRSIFDLSLLFGHRKPELQFEFLDQFF